MEYQKLVNRLPGGGALNNLVFLGSLGKIRALEINAQGVSKAWEDELKGAGYHNVHLYLFTQKNLLFGATKGRIMCFDASNGSEIWNVSPDAQSGIFAGDLMTLWCDNSMLISCANGSIVSLDLMNGNTLWQTRIERHAGSKWSCNTIIGHKNMIILGNAGEVFAYNKANGAQLWKNNLKGMGYNPICLATFTTTPGGYDADPRSDTLIVGTAGYVLALDLQGNIRHKVNLSGTGYNPVALLVDSQQGKVYTATAGEMRCFNAEGLTQVWKSTLPGMGSCWGHSLIFHENNIVIGMSGKVAALDKFSGREMWKLSLPGCGYSFVSVGTCADPNIFLCASVGKLYGVSKSNGQLIWTDSLPGMGYAHISLSTVTFNTDFNSSTLIQFIELERQHNNS